MATQGSEPRKLCWIATGPFLGLTNENPEDRNKARYSTDAPGPQQFPLVALIHGIRVVCQTGNTENDGKKRL